MKKLFVALLLVTISIASSAQLISSQSMVVKKQKLGPVEPGFEQMVEFGGKFGIDLAYTFNLNYTAGYRLNKTFFVGAGTGLVFNPGFSDQRLFYCHGDGSELKLQYDRTGWEDMHIAPVDIPLYAHVRAYFLNGRVLPFVGLSAGGVLSLSRPVVTDGVECWWSYCEDDHQDYSYEEIRYGTSSYLVEPSVGVNYRVTDRLGLYLSFAVKLRGIPYVEKLSKNGPANDVEFASRNVTLFGFNLGVSF